MATELQSRVAARFSANSSAADTVIVDGKILIQNRELKTLDEEKIIAEFTTCANRLTGK